MQQFQNSGAISSSDYFGDERGGPNNNEPFDITVGCVICDMWSVVCAHSGSTSLAFLTKRNACE
jgi:hypothetical protein